MYFFQLFFKENLAIMFPGALSDDNSSENIFSKTDAKTLPVMVCRAIHWIMCPVILSKDFQTFFQRLLKNFPGTLPKILRFSSRKEISSRNFSGKSYLRFLNFIKDSSYNIWKGTSSIFRIYRENFKIISK